VRALTATPIPGGRPTGASYRAGNTFLTINLGPITILHAPALRALGYTHLRIIPGPLFIKL
jgi:hypothetical protein